MAASLPPPLEFFNIEPSEEEHVPIEQTQEKLDEIKEYLQSDDNTTTDATIDNDTSVSSESGINTTESDEHPQQQFIAIKSEWPNGIQAMLSGRNKLKAKSLAQQKLIKQKPPNKRGTKGLTPCPWKELEATERKKSYVSVFSTCDVA